MKSSRIIIALMIATTTACGHRSTDGGQQEDILVEAGDSVLTVQEVMRHIPTGLDKNDSDELFRSIVDRWIRNIVLSEVAEKNAIDIEKINRMAEDYRNELIINQYLRSMDNNASVSDNAIKEYYAIHGKEMILTAPLVKGIYIKVPDDDERLGDLRRWLKNLSEQSVDNIEKYGLRNASQYEYFQDHWIGWEDMAEKIPYRFFDADAFLKSTRDFETSYGGSTYLLHISDFMLSGNEMPFDYASGIIARILDKRNREESRKQLITDIYKEKMAEGALRGVLYDPINGVMKTTSLSKESPSVHKKDKTKQK